MKSLASLALAAVMFSGCSPSIQADRAAQIARQFVMTGQPADSLVHDLKIAQPEWHTNKWRVQVDAIVTYRQPTVATVEVPVHYLIDVDGTSGQASIFAQG